MSKENNSSSDKCIELSEQDRNVLYHIYDKLAEIVSYRDLRWLGSETINWMHRSQLVWINLVLILIMGTTSSITILLDLYRTFHTQIITYIGLGIDIIIFALIFMFAYFSYKDQKTTNDILDQTTLIVRKGNINMLKHLLEFVKLITRRYDFEKLCSPDQELILNLYVGLDLGIKIIEKNKGK